jgi:flagellar biosynthesis anti-sigma factor FlgM
MRIDLTNKPQEARETARSEKTASRSAGRHQEAGDQAHLSFDQSRIQALEAQVASTADIRQAKVDALSRTVHDGTYNVPAQDTADAMLSEALAKTAARVR